MKRLTRPAKYLIFAAILLLALLRGLGYLASPLIREYRGEIVQLAEEQLGIPLHIREISFAWHGLRPSLLLQRVTAGVRHDLILGDIQLDIDPVSALLDGDLFSARLFLRRPVFHLVRERDGSTHLAGLATTPGEETPAAGPPEIPGWVQMEQAILIWNDRMRQLPPIAFSNIDLQLRQTAQRLDLSGAGRSAVGNLSFAAQIQGDLFSGHWSGDLYARTENLKLAELIKGLLPNHYRVDDAKVDLELWSRWDNGLHSRSTGNLAVRRLVMSSPEESVFTLDHLAGQFQMEVDADHWQLLVDELELEREGRRWPKGRLALRREQTPAGHTRIRAGADYLRIRDLTDLLHLRFPWAEFKETFAQLAPRGELKDSRVDLEFGVGHFRWAAQTALRNVAFDASGDIPAVQGLSGRLYGADNLIHLDLDSRDLEVELPRLFRWPLQLQRAGGGLDLEQRTDGSWELQGDGLILDNTDIHTRSRLRLWGAPEEPLRIDLQTDFSEGVAQNAKPYFPAHIMAPALVEWLDRAFVDGRVPQGSLVLNGPLRDFPFNKSANGHFEVLFDAEAVTLDYMPEWPPLTDLNATVRFHNNELDIQLKEGRIYNSRVTGGSARIPQLHPARPIEIKGKVDGALSDSLRLLKESPLRERFAEIIKLFEAEGDSHLALDFAVPLDQLGDYRLKGQVNFLGNTLRIPEWKLAIDKVSGPLHFDLDGLQGKSLKGEFLGGPSTFSVDSGGKGTQIIAKGHYTTIALQQAFPGLALLEADGAADFEVDLSIPPVRQLRSHPFSLNVRSPLRGIGVNLPAPLNKATDDELPMTLAMTLGGKQESARLQLGPSLEIRLEGALAAPQRISAEAERVDLSSWISRFKPADKEQPSDPIDPAGWPLLDLRCAHLEYIGHDFGEARLLTSRTAEGIAIETLSVDGGFARLSASGSWGKVGEEAPASHLQGEVQSDSLERLLPALDFSPQFFESPGKLSFDLDWPGAPFQFDKPSLNGNAHLNIRKGRLRDVDAKALRLFGLVNIGTLQRRLKLDFSDVTRKELAFDEINGHFVLDHGDAYTNDLSLKGPSLQATLSGRIGLASQDLDQLITVMPSTDSSLPIAGAIAGGPIGGAVGLLLQKIAKGKISHFNRFRYNVTGPWSDPQIEEADEDDAPPEAPATEEATQQGK